MLQIRVIEGAFFINPPLTGLRLYLFLFGISALRVLVHADGDVELHHLVKVVDGMLHVLWDGAAGEGLEIEQTGITPPLGITSLDAELALHLAEALGIDIGLHGVPDDEEMTYLAESVVVLVAQLIPEGASALHAVVPGNVVKPREQVLRTGVDVVVEPAECIRILLDVGRAFEGAVKAQSDAVSLMVVGRSPVDSHAPRTVPRLRAIMMRTSENMVYAQRHHVVDAGLTRVKHELDELSVLRRLAAWYVEGLGKPFLRNLL